MDKQMVTKPKRAKIIAHGDRLVEITFTDSDIGPERLITMEIWAFSPQKAGGYSAVMYDGENGDKQLCERLSSAGNTLMYKDGTKLVDLVRREYQAMRAAEKRDRRWRER
jgi:hypothetical protein